MSIQIQALQHSDRSEWEELARGYKAFYNSPTSPSEYAAAWEKLMSRQEVFGLGAKIDGHLVGITHYLFHATTWTPKVCYLQDLFTLPSARGKGVARSLIQAVEQQASAQGASRYYWHTHESNSTARSIYEQFAKFSGFVLYIAPLPNVAG